MTSDEPETEAGRALLAVANEVVDDGIGGTHLTISTEFLAERILAIEAELRASLAAKVRAEIAAFRRYHVRSVEEGADGEDALIAGIIDDLETAVRALIEGSDPAPKEET